MNVKIQAAILLLALTVGLAAEAAFGQSRTQLQPPSEPSEQPALRSWEKSITMPGKKQMSLGKQQVVSAQVVLRPASGKSIRSQLAITAENIGDFLPSAETALTATQAFAAAGFEVGPVVGISFSITAPVETFEKVFDTHLRLEERGGIKAIGPDKSVSLELPLQALPKAITDNVEAVTFTPPPDFGPTEFMP